MFGTLDAAPAGYEELTAAGLTTPQIDRLAQLGPAELQRLAHLLEVYPSLEDDASRAGAQRVALVRWCHRGGRLPD